MPSRLSIITLLLAALAVAGCSPVTVSFTLFGDNARVREVEVDRDDRARQKVAIIDVRGMIADQPTGFLATRGSAVDELSAQLSRAEADRQVSAVILRINSPGGSVAASDMMYREIRRFSDRSGKPIIASLGEVAASGGYYIALAADHIVAEPTSITGSIGVIIPTFNFSEGLNRIGIYSRSVTSAGNKDLANPFEPVDEAHYAILQSMVDEFYGKFSSLVSERRSAQRLERSVAAPLESAVPKRSINTEDLHRITDGRIMTGLHAHRHGLVDDTGGIREAFEAAKTLAGLDAARLVKYYREDAGKPRSPFAAAPTASPGAAPGSEGFEINLLQIRGPLPGLAELQPGIAYYIYVPPGAL